MKKILVLGILVLFLGSLIAAESGPSDTVGFIKYGMVVGSTFIANPMDAGYTTSALMGDAITSADQMSYWDASSQGWVSSIKNLFGNWVGAFAVTGGMPVMARTTAISDFYVAGGMYLPEPNYSLVVGTNAVMVPLSKSALTTSALVGDDMGLVDQMSYWNAGSQGWVSSIKNLFGNWVGPFATDIGMPLMARATAVFNWPVADAIAGEKYVPAKKSVITRKNVITGKKVKFDTKK